MSRALTFLFPHPAPAAGDYLLGEPSWARPVTLTGARVTGVAGSTGETVLGLEIGGALSGVTLTLRPDAAGEVMMRVFPLAVALAGGTIARWKVLSGPGDVTRLGLTLSALQRGADVRAAQPLFVRFVHGRERLRIFEYDPATAAFTETQGGISSGRAVIENGAPLAGGGGGLGDFMLGDAALGGGGAAGGIFRVEIQGRLAMTVDEASRMRVNAYHVNGGSGALRDTPRLEFCRGFDTHAARLATLTREGILHLPEVSEHDSVSGGPDRFEFYAGGVLCAVLGGAGLHGRALGLRDPLPAGGPGGAPGEAVLGDWSLGG